MWHSICSDRVACQYLCWWVGDGVYREVAVEVSVFGPVRGGRRVVGVARVALLCGIDRQYFWSSVGGSAEAVYRISGGAGVWHSIWFDLAYGLSIFMLDLHNSCGGAGVRLICRERAQEPQLSSLTANILVLRPRSIGHFVEGAPACPPFSLWWAHFTLGFAASRILWLPGIDARNWSLKGHSIERSASRLNMAFMPVCLGSTQD